jgi:hypothetical protein
MAGEEGCCVDLFGLHEAGWMSVGRPTSLVRDGGVEARDPPPSVSPTGPSRSWIPMPPVVTISGEATAPRPRHATPTLRRMQWGTHSTRAAGTDRGVIIYARPARE